MEVSSFEKTAVRGDFLARKRPRQVPTDTPGVFLRVLPFGVMIDDIYPVARTERDVTIPILARALCFGDGSPLFETAKEAEEALRDCAGSDLVDLVKDAMRLNGLGADGEDDAKKNSTAPTPDSP